MPTEFAIDREHGLVISRGTGVFRHADFLDHMARLGRCPDFRPEFNQLVDCRGFDAVKLTAGDLQDLGERSIFAASAKRAFVVASQVQYGLGRMFAAYRELKSGQTTMVFRTLEEAVRWLGLPAGYDPAAAFNQRPRPAPPPAGRAWRGAGAGP